MGCDVEVDGGVCGLVVVGVWGKGVHAVVEMEEEATMWLTVCGIPNGCHKVEDDGFIQGCSGGSVCVVNGVMKTLEVVVGEGKDWMRDVNGALVGGGGVAGDMRGGGLDDMLGEGEGGHEWCRYGG